MLLSLLCISENPLIGKDIRDNEIKTESDMQYFVKNLTII